MHPLRNAALLGGLALLGLPVANAAELIISEYVEGSGNNKALEFYNSGSQVLDLSAYRVEFYFNGASAAGRSIDLSGSLAPGKTFVLANGVADPALLALASQRVEGSWFNGNDAVLLRRRSGEILDSLGQVGFNPGTTWGSGDVQTLDRSLVRKADIRDGDSDPSDAFDPAAQWLGYPRDTFANLGQHGAGEPGGGEEAGLRPIHEVQGAGAESPLVNQRVAIEGVVVGDFQNASELKGFYVQQEDATVDGDPATSEGIFVYDGGNGSDVKLGDRVRVTGQVREFNGLTELVGPLQVSVLASGVALPTPAGISLPLASADALERYEGMRVQLRQTLTVNEVYNLGRYGEVLLSSGGRQMTPTNVVAPGEQAKAMQARNDLDRILLDDGRSGQNPDPIRYPAPELSAYNSLRVGDRTSAIDGVLDYSAGSYRIQLLQTPTFEAANPRPAQPAVEGRLRVASFNVLNYFNGDGKGGGFPTSRGANTAEEFQRQKAKIVAAILASKADIVGLMEIENDGYGEFSAIADLVNGLNASLPQGQRYAFVNPNRAKLGSDEIAVGLIYRGDKVRTYRSAAVLDSSVNPEFDDTRNRPTLAQTFQEINGGERLTIAVNHLKSKGSACDGDPDTGDGQGNCNLTRARAAQALVDWLAGDPTGAKEPDRLIIGDLNSYAKEDPVNVIRSAGYTDLVARQAGAGKGYSYVFSGQSGYLDHALANASLARQVRGAVEWHINADEPRVLDYNVEFKTPRQQDSLYNAEPYRASDHDPVVIGIDLRRVAMKKHRR
ncbi:ExeM/NucH family extracellular endonuclease [Pseudomonas aeruginosa]|uniref:endonuclease/exonuclease/phosphatase family protein n=1 Tax=Pseudomonas aeruginosa TaxID=287 RepID=UPI000442E789|nr:SpnA family nuclease [Pseudomonas aeruginosa]AHW69518.1 Extracelullar DNA degradation protein, EddB [Pseudomonas aeruginosa PA96]KSH25132.1 DNA degradation protein EddB [Pseudomonas aeruginosa]MBV5590482.1 SpnA family nuclease [Pseudomonas aeruginosa]MBX5593913.1 ExeM/NucH family extracellular endonuclease [Pseudomonas aeruginosa]MBX6004155.1 ExeM/NucH family extracellular endonuclease [Pseudomonas aeruginosa]